MGSIALRRTKEQTDGLGRPIIELPSKTVQICHLELSEEERKIYTAMETDGREIFNSYIEAGTVV